MSAFKHFVFLFKNLDFNILFNLKFFKIFYSISYETIKNSLKNVKKQRYVHCAGGAFIFLLCAQQ